MRNADPVRLLSKSATLYQKKLLISLAEGKRPFEVARANFVAHRNTTWTRSESGPR